MIAVEGVSVSWREGRMQSWKDAREGEGQQEQVVLRKFMDQQRDGSFVVGEAEAGLLN